MDIQQDWLNHKALQIIKGIGKTPTDTNSAEPALIVVNLMSGPITLESDGWTPEIAAVKAGGVWTESPVNDGRTLLAAPVGNVTETMSVRITGHSFLEVNHALLALNKMAQDCRDFWQSDAQVDPVYLLWEASCGAGPQYALLYNMELAPEYESGVTPTLRASLVLEREPFWRGLSPGANPKLWTFYVNGQAIGAGKTLADATLISGSDHLVTQSVSNKSEWTPAALGLQTAYISQNFIDIPAALIPGDAPALLELSAEETALSNLTSLYVGLSSKDLSAVNQAGVLKANAYVLAAGDGDVLNGAAKNIVVVGTGERSNGSAVNYYNVSKALLAGDTTYTPYLTWGGNLGSILQLGRHFYRGRFAVFLRAKGATDDTTQKAKVSFYETEGAVVGGSMIFNDIPIKGVGAGTVYFPTYVGVVTLPLSSREAVSLDGSGTMIKGAGAAANELYIEVALKNSSGAGRTVTMLDLVLMPMDEFLMQLTVPLGSGQPHMLMDSTGYIGHGRTDGLGVNYDSTSDKLGANVEVRGATPYLLPKTDQRLYFLMCNSFTTESTQPNDAITVRLNIVPRWSGIRDV